jgi:hypothetical protein
MATGGQTATGGGAGAGGSEPDPRDGMMLEVTYLGLNPDRDWDPDESISRPDPYICIEYETFVGCSPTCMDCMQTPMAWPYNDRGELILVHEGGRLEITVWEEDGEGQEDEYCASTTLQLTTIVQLPHEMRIMFGDVVRMDLRLSVPSEGLPVE